MKSILIWQELWRRRLIVGIALLASVGAGGLITLQSRQHQVGVASSRVLIDTPQSIVADLNPQGALSLSVHAQLLADLIASQRIRALIAHSLNIRIDSLAVVPPVAAAGAPVATPLATAGTPRTGTSTLTIGVDSTLPLVSISAQAPDRAQAAKLADGAVAALQSYLVSVAAEQKIPAASQPVIKPLGTQSATATRGRSPVFGVAVTLGLFSLFCYVLLAITRVRQGVRGSEPSTGPFIETGTAGPEPALWVSDDDDSWFEREKWFVPS